MELLAGVSRISASALCLNDDVGCKQIKREHHGYSDTDKLLHVVHNHERSTVVTVDHILDICSGFGVSHAK